MFRKCERYASVNSLLPVLVEPDPAPLVLDVATRDAIERERIRDDEEKSEAFLRSLLERRPGLHVVRTV